MSGSMVLFAALGLVMGSFVNVLIHRLPLMIEASHNATSTSRFDLSWPASHCPHCQARLRFWHNVPVLSFLVLQGRCAFCHRAISVRYPLIELLTALIWVACAWHWDAGWSSMSWALFATILLALSVIDAKTTLLPDLLTQTLLWLGLAASALDTTHISSQDAVWGAILGYGSLWLIATVFEHATGKVGMGAGDFKLLAALGAWLGAWTLIPLVFLASTTGALIGLVLMLSKKMQRHDYLPFGPFLAAAGALLAWLGHAQVLRALQQLFIA